MTAPLVPPTVLPPGDLHLTEADFDADGYYRAADSVHVVGTLTVAVKDRWARFRGAVSATAGIKAGWGIEAGEFDRGGDRSRQDHQSPGQTARRNERGAGHAHPDR